MTRTLSRFKDLLINGLPPRHALYRLSKTPWHVEGDTQFWTDNVRDLYENLYKPNSCSLVTTHESKRWYCDTHSDDSPSNGCTKCHGIEKCNVERYVKLNEPSIDVHNPMVLEGHDEKEVLGLNDITVKRAIIKHRVPGLVSTPEEPKYGVFAARDLPGQLVLAQYTGLMALDQEYHDMYDHTDCDEKHNSYLGQILL